MFVNMADFKILGKDSILRKAILKALSDEYSRTIMNFTIEQVFGLESLDVQIVENDGMGVSAYW